VITISDVLYVGMDSTTKQISDMLCHGEPLVALDFVEIQEAGQIAEGISKAQLL
jgi:hypothetical protein